MLEHSWAAVAGLVAIVVAVAGVLGWRMARLGRRLKQAQDQREAEAVEQAMEGLAAWRAQKASSDRAPPSL